MFDWQKPTVEMLGRWQPWHDGHTALFERAHAITGQVAIMVRDVGGIMGMDAGANRTGTKQTDNPFDFDEVKANLQSFLQPEGESEGDIVSEPAVGFDNDTSNNYSLEGKDTTSKSDKFDALFDDKKPSTDDDLPF